MPTTLQMVRELSDSQVVAVARELFSLVYEEIPYEEVSGNFGSVPEVGALAGLDEMTLKRDLPAAESARLGRLLLETFAGDPALEPFVREAIEKVHASDDLIVLEILALGLVVNLTLLVATTKVKVKKGADGKIKWEVNKGKASPELVKAVVEPIVDAAKTVAG